MSPRKPSFGFGGLSEITPSRSDPAELAPAAPTTHDLDAFSKRAGFPSREESRRQRRARPSDEEPVDHLHLRGYLSDLNAFVAWCDREKLSYREAFRQLARNIPGR